MSESQNSGNITGSMSAPPPSPVTPIINYKKNSPLHVSGYSAHETRGIDIQELADKIEKQRYKIHSDTTDEQSDGEDASFFDSFPPTLKWVIIGAGVLFFGYVLYSYISSSNREYIQEMAKPKAPMTNSEWLEMFSKGKVDPSSLPNL
jgi:hypothetical protein